METLYYPCIADISGKIRKQLNTRAMSKNDAEIYLKKHYARAWLRCEAIPQPVNHHYFKGK